MAGSGQATIVPVPQSLQLIVQYLDLHEAVGRAWWFSILYPGSEKGSSASMQSHRPYRLAGILSHRVEAGILPCLMRKNGGARCSGGRSLRRGPRGGGRPLSRGSRERRPGSDSA